MPSIIEQEAGVRAGQWVRLTDGRVGLVREATDLNGYELGTPSRPGARVIFRDDDIGTKSELVDAKDMTPTDPRPWVGMEATYCVGSDAYPYEVVGVTKSGKGVRVRPLKKIAVEAQGPYSEARGHYAYASDPDAEVTDVTFRKNGRWVERGSSMNFCGFALGFASYYQDPHF